MLRKELSACELCPRRCRANRLAGERGICGADGRLVVARAALHHWEEPPVSGSGGSGTVFFSNCSLRCVYCQNESISAGRVGRAVSVARLAEMFLELEGQGAHNINLVTPTHYALHIIEAVLHAREAGLAVPVIYNTSGYELPAAIARLDGVVDVYLSDFKYASPKLAGRYSDAPDYPEVALAALRAMVAQAGEYRLGRDGMVEGGVIVRHLMLPGMLEDSKEVVARVFGAVGNAVCYSLMNQFTPGLGSAGTGAGSGASSAGAGAGAGAECKRFPELDARVSEEDYSALVDFALDLGIEHSFMQVGDTAKESFIPPFDLTGV